MSDDTLDVRCLPYMPLQIERLRRSKAWLRCKRRPELAFYIMNLWMRSWHELPAGSLEDDDDVLADAAMCSPEEWERVRTDVLAGWELRDGRYHHPVVIEIATEGASKLRKNASRTAAAREAAARVREQSQGGDDPSPGSGTEPVTDPVTEDVTGDEGKGREGKKDSSPSSEGSPRPKRKQASLCPDDYEPKPRHYDWAAQHRQSRAWVDAEAERMKRWSAINAHRHIARKSNWDMALDNWLEGAFAKLGEQRGSTGPPRSARADYGQIALVHDAEVRSFLDDSDSEDPQVEIIPPGRRLA